MDARNSFVLNGTARLNVGCGMTPTAGWVNFDNSPSVKVARSVLGPLALALADAGQKKFIRFARDHDVRWALAQNLPMPDSSAQVIYTSHMVEHLDAAEAKEVLREFRRVLHPGGVLRVSVPDIRVLVDEYLQTGDADRFIGRTSMVHAKPRGLLAKLKFALLTGFRRHNWMYDGASLSKLLSDNGFADPIVQPPGQTRIPDPGPLDLHERAASSVYVEAIRV